MPGRIDGRYARVVTLEELCIAAKKELRLLNRHPNGNQKIGTSADTMIDRLTYGVAEMIPAPATMAAIRADASNADLAAAAKADLANAKEQA